jgi:hypothetical protein
LRFKNDNTTSVLRAEVLPEVSGVVLPVYILGESISQGRVGGQEVLGFSGYQKLYTMITKKAIRSLLSEN